MNNEDNKYQRALIKEGMIVYDRDTNQVTLPR